jgi:hypothetical protein
MYLLKKFNRNILLFTAASNLSPLEMSTILSVRAMQNNLVENEQVQSALNGADVVTISQIQSLSNAKNTNRTILNSNSHLTNQYFECQRR